MLSAPGRRSPTSRTNGLGFFNKLTRSHQIALARGESAQNTTMDGLDSRHPDYNRLADKVFQWTGALTNFYADMGEAVTCLTEHDAPFASAPAREAEPDTPSIALREGCTPKQLSAASTETVRLYDQLQGFKTTVSSRR